MVRSIARVGVALALVATSAIAADSTTWSSDYKSWIEDIKASVAGNANLAPKAAALEATLDAAVAAGVSEVDRMRLLYDFLAAADSDPTFQGFVTKDVSAAASATTAPSSAAASNAASSIVTIATIAVAVLGYALL